MGLTGDEAVVDVLRVQSVWVHEVIPRRVQEGTLLVPGLAGVPLRRGVQVPVLGAAWTGDRGVRVEEGIVGSLGVRELVVVGIVTEVHTGNVVVVEERHLWQREAGLGVESVDLELERFDER